MLLSNSPHQTDTLEQSQAAYSLLMTEYEDAIKHIRYLESFQQTLNTKILNLEEEVTRLKEQIRLMQHQRFGKKSEVNIGEPIVNPENVQLQTVSGYTRRKSKKPRIPLDFSALPHHQFYHDLSDEHKFCKGCANPLSKIGQDVSEQIEIMPQRLYVAEHIRYKYACRHCETLYMAPKPKAPIPKALAGGSLLTEIIVNKYQYHLPLYRQSKILASYTVNIPDNTLGQWVIQSGTGLVPVYEAFWNAILATFYLQLDETPVKVLKPEKVGYLWTYFAPYVGKGLVVFELSLTRSGEVAEKRLANFEGQLQTDGYVGYQNLRKRQGIRGFGCMSHARRKFDEVLKITKNLDGIAAEVIKRLKPVYALEEKMREMEVSFHTRKRLRQKQAWPILKSLHSWLRRNAPKVPAKSKLAGAIQYMLTQWPYLIKYLRHGCVEIDTNWVENRIREPALGKRNWLFMGHEDSGMIHALWYSLVISAVINGLNPRVYIHYLLSKTHDIRTKAIDPITLLPHTIDLAQLKVFADQQIAIVKEILDSS